jgi:hypothetical protein
MNQSSSQSCHSDLLLIWQGNIRKKNSTHTSQEGMNSSTWHSLSTLSCTFFFYWRSSVIIFITWLALQEDTSENAVSRIWCPEFEV